jgi:hypothetical protein
VLAQNTDCELRGARPGVNRPRLAGQAEQNQGRIKRDRIEGADRGAQPLTVGCQGGITATPVGNIPSASRISRDVKRVSVVVGIICSLMRQDCASGHSDEQHGYTGDIKLIRTHAIEQRDLEGARAASIRHVENAALAARRMTSEGEA